MTIHHSDLLHYREIQSIDRRSVDEGAYAIAIGSAAPWQDRGSYPIDRTLATHGYYVSTDQIDADKPNLTINRTDGHFVFTAVDWTRENAGSTTRQFQLKFALTPQNTITYDNTDLCWLRWTTSRSGIVVTPSQQAFHFEGGFQPPFEAAFLLTIDAAPTTSDWISCVLTTNVDHMDYGGYRLTYVLPDLASVVQQDYELPQAEHKITPYARGAPDEVWIFDVTALDPNNEGSASRPDEDGEAEVVSASYGSLSGKQVLTVQQDLRELQLHLRSTQTPTYVDEVDVYVVSWQEEVLAPHVVARSKIGGSADYNHRITLKGLLRGQHIILVSAQQIASSLTHSVGSPHVRWDVSLADDNTPAQHQVAPGIIATWWQAHEDVADDLELFDDIPHPRYWTAVRTTSNGIVSTCRWVSTDMVHASAGGPDKATPVLGPYSVRTGSAHGQIVHNRELQIWRDGTTYKLRFYNAGSRDTNVYLDRIEIDYLPGPAPPR